MNRERNIMKEAYYNVLCDRARDIYDALAETKSVDEVKEALVLVDSNPLKEILQAIFEILKSREDRDVELHQLKDAH